MQLKIISWNIWHGKYLDDVIEYLRKADADIIGLQEVIVYEKEGKQINIANEIIKKLGNTYTYVYCKTFTSDRHTPPYEQGNAILSKYPIENMVCHLLSTVADYKGSAETEPRGAVTVDVIIEEKKLHIFNTHLAYSHELHPVEIRDKQVKELLRLIKDESTLLLGDFNSEPETENIKQVAAVLQHTDNHLEKKSWTVYPSNYNGFITNGLEYRIDYIFASEDIKVIQTTLGETKASDHLPVLATIEI